ncbi:MAG: hypothetical protein N2V78_00365 [Methanophagales archaeon]|nr:hypothetical protein [Methanophagales archaeon]
MGRELNKAFEKRRIGDYEYTFVISKNGSWWRGLNVNIKYAVFRF